MASTLTLSPSYSTPQNASIPPNVTGSTLVKEGNKAFLDSLVSEFGANTVRELCDKIPPSFANRFFLGEIALTDFESDLKTKARQILIRQIIEANPLTIEKLAASPIEIRHLLSERTTAELLSFAAAPEALAPLEQTLRSALKDMNAAAAANIELITQLEQDYSKEVFQSAYQLIPLSRRLEIEAGSFDLTPSAGELRQKCEALLADKVSVGILPEKEELADFLQTARVTNFIDAYQGVFLVEGTYKGKPLTIVVKAADKPSQETFGAKVLAEMQIKTPHMHVIDCATEQEIATPLLQLLQKPAKDHDKPFAIPPKNLCILSYIPGTTLEDLQASDLANTSPQDMHKVLEDMGEIAAGDLLLYNRERLPTISGGNLANIMILKDNQGACSGAVAIDSAASLKEKSLTSQWLNISPFKQIGNIVAKIAASPDEISEPAKAIYDDALPDAVKDLVGKDQALQSLQKGMLRGLSEIAKLDEEQLRTIHATTPPTSDIDIVDLHSHEIMLETIQKTLIVE